MAMKEILDVSLIIDISFEISNGINLEVVHLITCSRCFLNKMN